LSTKNNNDYDNGKCSEKGNGNDNDNCLGNSNIIVEENSQSIVSGEPVFAPENIIARRSGRSKPGPEGASPPHSGGGGGVAGGERKKGAGKRKPAKGGKRRIAGDETSKKTPKSNKENINPLRTSRPSNSVASDATNHKMALNTTSTTTISPSPMAIKHG
jgi:hypothetical protein